MPPITITAHQQTEDGWYVAWHDDANLDGLPLDGFFHLTEAKLEELVTVRNLVRAPVDKLKTAIDAMKKRKAGNPPPNQDNLPAEIAEWRDGYEDLITDSIDRNRFGLPPNAPHSELVEARESDSQLTTHQQTGFEEFIEKTIADEGIGEQHDEE